VIETAYFVDWDQAMPQSVTRQSVDALARIRQRRPL